jgi:hypothetical protein
VSGEQKNEEKETRGRVSASVPEVSVSGHHHPPEKMRAKLRSGMKLVILSNVFHPLPGTIT